ncbi:oxidoreductase family protein [Algibacter mikhailovii]|uniref:Phosphotransferase n=1 Tax=Algibacter mikhailovii TaxID=425498 RepID=A0A918RCG3_9FLAO|nr:oxidoreductase family protein [Algibacter mikhailovii]GGZ93690.1 phosphotransferase [Algibacter mikhailovii]
METDIQNIILKTTHAQGIVKTKVIQSLWSGYGQIMRITLTGAPYESVVVKYIKPPLAANHPRGWNTNTSHQRKLKSYQVELAFYKSYSGFCNASCYIPSCIHFESIDTEAIIILEDLDASGFSERKTSVTATDLKLCLSWLAHFHACFMGKPPKDLWKTGTYWHLETRPDELEALEDLPLKDAAAAINQKLNSCKYQTFVHGDAKLANFCFSPNGLKVAAVDFQYVGGGCGMKDVAYFIGSCLDEAACETLETELLDFYFNQLSIALSKKNTSMNAKTIEQEWRAMYPVAWTDFHRFIKGWSPGHWKINSYSETIAQHVLLQLKNHKL